MEQTRGAEKQCSKFIPFDTQPSILLRFHFRSPRGNRIGGLELEKSIMLL